MDVAYYTQEGFMPRLTYPDSFKELYAYESEDAILEDQNIALSIGYPEGFTVLQFPSRAAYDASPVSKNLTVVLNPDDSVSVWFKWPRYAEGFNSSIKSMDARLICKRYLVPAPPSRVGGIETRFLVQANPLLQEYDFDPALMTPTTVRPFALQAISLKGMMSFSPPEQAEYIEGGVLDAKGKLLLVGAPKVGKSRIALNLGFSLVTGLPFLGLQTAGYPRVLSIQFEVSERRYRARVNSVAAALKIPRDNELPIYFLTLPSLRLDNRQGLLELYKLIRVFRAEVLILDPMVKIHTGSENEVSEMQDLLNKIDEMIEDLDLAVVMVHHLNKASDSESWARIRGSSYIPAWADSLLILDKPRDGKPIVRAMLRNGEDFTRAIKFNDDHSIQVIGTIETAIEIMVQELVFQNPGITRQEVVKKTASQYGVQDTEVHLAMKRMEANGYTLPS